MLSLFRRLSSTACYPEIKYLQKNFKNFNFYYKAKILFIK